MRFSALKATRSWSKLKPRVINCSKVTIELHLKMSLIVLTKKLLELQLKYPAKKTSIALWEMDL